jgi:DNA-binding NtrC family response regulator
MKMFKILIIEDDINSSKVFSRILIKEGYDVDCVYDGEQAVSIIPKEDYDLLIIDMNLPGMNGFELLKKVKKTNLNILTIMVTAYASINLAVDALKAGANDFIEKPVVPEKFLHVIKNTFEAQRLKKEVTALRSDLSQRYEFAHIVGKHRKMKMLFQLIESLTDTLSSVLITGETGTGKDLVARAIHYHSKRKDKPFVAINCAALPTNLLESELFGYEKGAFTGANKRKIGKVEQADGGTLFLDEIGDAPLLIQVKLLRAVQTRKIERLGSTKSISLNIRIISATNKDLAHEISKKRFRMDLFYRLNVIPVDIPPLRERMEDIPLLVDHFLAIKGQEEGNACSSISEQTLSQLMNHSWPGNVRELENVLERALIFNQGNVIENVLFSNIKMDTSNLETDFSLAVNTNLPLTTLRDNICDKLEKEYLTKLLKIYNGSVKHTAEHAGVAIRTIRRKMKNFNLDKRDFK